MSDVLTEQHAAFEPDLQRWLHDVWQPPLLTRARPAPGSELLQTPDDPDAQLLGQGLRELAAAWGEATVGRLAADLFFAPGRWRHTEYAGFSLALFRLVETLVECFPSADVDGHLEERLARLLQHPFEDARLPLGIPPDHGPADVSCFVRVLSRLPTTPARLDLMERLVRGELDGGPFVSPFGDGRIFQAEEVQRNPAAIVLLWSPLDAAGRFDYALFRAAVLQRPSLAASASQRTDAHGHTTTVHTLVSAALGDRLLDFSQWLAAELEDAPLGEDTARVLAAIQDLRGPRHLIAAAQHHAAAGLGVVCDRRWEQPAVERAIVHLAMAEDTAPGDPDERAQVVAALRAVPPGSLVHLLPVARHGRAVLCEALGWQRALPLVELIVELARQKPGRWLGDVQNCADPTEGAIDVRAAHAALQAAGEETARTILAGFARAEVQATNAAFLLEATGGWNRARVLRGVERNQQIAIKAFGVLPLDSLDPTGPTDATDDVLRRYLRLRQSHTDARQFGAERQANQEAAVQVGLANLAHLAGFADATRLEWAMEARLAADVAPVGRRWHLGAYELELQFDPQTVDAHLAVRRDGARLKNVPTPLRREPAYAAAREAVAELRRQSARFRDALESIVASGESLSQGDLGDLVRLPVARALLETLVAIDATGTIGLLRAEPLGLEPLDGQRVPLSGPLRLAHPYDLFGAGTLAAWQRHFVHRRLRQPFKQVFRELYLLTPAEQATATFSNRFAGHSVDARIASRLLQRRGWQTVSTETTLPYKPLPALGLCAVFTFPDAGHYLSELPVITTDQIRFVRAPSASRFGDLWSAPGVPLARVPPLALSEVMRDADLVVSVAQRAGEAVLSVEMYQRRAELLRALIDDLGLPGVTTAGHFAFVHGTRASYRVHLGSAAIHIEPGQYLCIVPATWGRTHPQLFLPFADEGDSKISEVISKVLLLVRDDRIRDETILRQIGAPVGP